MLFTRKIQTTLSILVSACLLLSTITFDIYAQQTPGEEEFSPIGPIGVTNELSEAKENLWSLILGEDENVSGATASVFDDVDILISGIMEIEGENFLYLGVDEEDWDDDEKINKLKSTLKDLYPNVPVYMEATEGVDLLTSSTQTLTFTETPNEDIEDNSDRQDASDYIRVNNEVVIDDISVHVNITHSYIGDLKVQLTTPSGELVDLHHREGGSSNNINKTYTTTDEPGLRSLIGEDADGRWELSVGDYASGDTGTFNSWTLSITPRASSTPNPTSSTSDIFNENFESGLGSWVVSTDSSDTGWRTKTHDEGDIIDGHTSSNSVAEAEECDDPCSITLRSGIDLSSHSSATLSFNRWIDTSIDNGEYLKVEISNNGNYREIFNFNAENDDDDDEWYHETYTLTSSDLNSTDFKIRFTAEASASSEEVAIDNVVISQGDGGGTEPDVKTCFNGPNRSSASQIAGGDKLFKRSSSRNILLGCASIGLGGVETKDGKKGFITAAHVVSEDYINRDIFFGHKIEDQENPMGSRVYKPLGKAEIMPGRVLFRDIASTTDKKIISVDAAFVEYPKRDSCETDYEWTDDGDDYCFQYRHDEQAASMKVRGNNDTLYTVTGSASPDQLTDINSVRFFGATTREEVLGTVKLISSGQRRRDNKALVKLDGDNAYIYMYNFVGSRISVDGDSGSPVYTTPNSSNEVKIVGFVSGSFTIAGAEKTFFSSWEDTAEALGLKDPQ